MKKKLTAAVFVIVASMASVAHAQNIDKAIDAYKDKNFDEAAVRFFEVLRFDTSEGNIVEAEYGIAQSMLKLGLALPAVRYYENIIAVGPTHPYYLKAFEGLVDAADMLHDDLIVPAILDKKYGEDLGKLQPDMLQRIHYMLGERLYKMQKRGESLDFLGTVKKGNRDYPKSQYLQGMIFLGRSAGAKADYERAIESFENVRKAIAKDSADESRRNLRELATLALARIYYEMGAQLPAEDPKDETKPNLDKQKLMGKSIELFKEIPRFSTHWSEALYERAWADILIPMQGKNAKGQATVTQAYGKSLGALHAVHAPYFVKEYWPESYILKSIVYFYNCHFDSVYKVLGTLQKEYEPISTVMERLLKNTGVADEAYDELLYDSLKADRGAAELVKADSSQLLIPGRVARYLSRDPQWKKLSYFTDEIHREAKFIKSNKTLSGGEVGHEMLLLIDKNEKQFKAVAGRWVRRQLTDTQNYLQSYINRATIVKLETETAEKEWLEMGRSIDKGPRARLPRPYIPNDKFQYFNFNGEYWADELGYYQYSIRTECFE